jgi:hypothetical protein
MNNQKRMTLNEIAINRLINQQISNPKLKTPQEVLEWMGAIQAQDYAMSKLAIGIRLPNNAFDKQIEDDLNNGKIIRTHLLRPTWHLVSADDVRWMMQLSAPNLNKSVASMNRSLGLDETVLKKSNSLIRKLLEKNEILTREEIMNELNKKGIATNDLRASHIMFRAETEMIVCNGERVGKQLTYALFDRKVPAAKPLQKDEALARLAEKYIQSRSPVTIKDFVWWSGLNVSDAKKAFEMVKSKFISSIIENEEYWTNETDNLKTNKDNSVYFLPAFDELIISYKDRTATIEAENQAKAFTKNGIFYPTIIYNGKVIGTWKKVSKGNETEILPSFFSSLTESQKKKYKTAETKLKLFYE